MPHPLRSRLGPNLLLKGPWRALFILWLLVRQIPLLTAQSGDASIEFFESRIRPFLITDCQECHGPKHQRGGLRVDSREALLRGGDSGPAVIPNKAQESRLLRAIQHLEPDLQMPKERPRLPETVIRDVARWIDAGAVFPVASGSSANSTNNSSAWPRVFEARRQWWSFQPPVAAPVPVVNRSEWSTHPVDRFILARLEAEGLQPAAPAEPQVWLRRVHWTLTGLPPEPANVVAFLANPSLEARARVVDALLASPRFGERWARHWMDLVRFADSYGHEQDYTIPYAWRYRDYLIRAFNADVPYDVFVQEHMAGDLLPNPRRHPGMGFNESVLATGFWYLHQATHAPVDPLQDEADRIDNQVDVFSKTFLGLTVACARCHDHKFDAISTQDYYSLSGFLRASRQDIASLDPDGTLEPRLNSRIQDDPSISKKLRTILRGALKDATPRVAPYLIQAQELLRSNIASNAWPGEVLATARRHGLDAGILDRNPGGLEPSAAALAGCGRQTGLYGRTLQRIRVYPGHHQPSPVDPPPRSRHLEGQWTGVPDSGTPRGHLAGRVAGNGILARKYRSQRPMGPESSRNPPLSDLHSNPQSSPPAGGRTQLKDPAHHRPLWAPRIQPPALRIHPN